MTPKFDWILDSSLKTEIIQAWEEYQRHPETWRLNRYLFLVESVPLEDEDIEIKYCVRPGDAHQPSPTTVW